ncbi:MAG: hypothetical protein RL367_2311 [Pseudomonadota bacterium]
MNKYNGFSLRDSAIAMVCSIIFSASCLMFAIGPAMAAPHNQTQNSVVVPLA